MQLPDPQTVLDRGDDASRLLANPTFEAVMNDLSNFHLSAMVATPSGPLGAETRDYHHGLLAALREVHEALTGHVAAAAEMRARIKLHAEDEFPADDEDTEV